jgi:hypothetical protein
MAVYTFSFADIKDKDGNAVRVALASGGNIPSGTKAPVQADPAIGSVSDPIATNWVGDLSLISMQKAALKKQLEPKTNLLARQMWSAASSDPASVISSSILSDGGAYATTQSPTAIQPIRLMSIGGMVLPTTSTTSGYYGDTTTVTPAVDGYLLVIGSRNGSTGPPPTHTLSTALLGRSSGLEILTIPLYLPGGHAGSSNTATVSSSGNPPNVSTFGGRTAVRDFVGGFYLPGGCTIVVSTQPDAYVPHPSAYAQITYELT